MSIDLPDDERAGAGTDDQIAVRVGEHRDRIDVVARLVSDVLGPPEILADQDPDSLRSAPSASRSKTSGRSPGWNQRASSKTS